MEKDLLGGDFPLAEACSDVGGCDCARAENACHGHEGCGEGSFGLAGRPLAMVYAPCQEFRALYDPATALGRGTLFCELDLPFGCCHGASCKMESR